MSAPTYRFTTPLWEWGGRASWFFVTVPEAASDEIDEITTLTAGGFGSVRVRVTVGATTWMTSLFPSKQEAAYVLPIKRAVRAAEGLEPGHDVDVAIELADHSV